LRSYFQGIVTKRLHVARSQPWIRLEPPGTDAVGTEAVTALPVEINDHFKYIYKPVTLKTSPASGLKTY
jgi:hypothetical protein